MTKKECWKNFVWVLACLLSWCFGYFTGVSDYEKYEGTNVSIIEYSSNTQKSDNAFEKLMWINDCERDLFHAIAEVESNHDDNAVGDNGRSKGRYQIGRAYWNDGCEYLNMELDYDANVKKHEVCETVMKAYWERYGAETPEEKCRIHNGGPKGMEKDGTKKYWEKVKKVLENIK